MAGRDEDNCFKCCFRRREVPLFTRALPRDCHSKAKYALLRNDILTLLATLDLLQIYTLIAKQRWFAILYYHVLALLQARLEMSANGNSWTLLVDIRSCKATAESAVGSHNRWRVGLPNASRGLTLMLHFPYSSTLGGVVARCHAIRRCPSPRLIPCTTLLQFRKQV